MAKVKVHAGDWAKSGEHSFSWGVFSLRKDGAWLPEAVPAQNLASIEVASEENVKRIGGAAGWATVGALALGPVGLVAGLVLGGNKKEVTFVAQFVDGRRMLATTEAKAFTQMQAAVFDRASSPIVTAAVASPSVTYKLSPSENEKLAKQMREDVGDALTTEDADQYEQLHREGRMDEANAFFGACLEKYGLRDTMEHYGFTEEEARRFQDLCMDPAKSEEAQAMLMAATDPSRSQREPETKPDVPGDNPASNEISQDTLRVVMDSHGFREADARHYYQLLAQGLIDEAMAFQKTNADKSLIKAP